MIAISDVDVWGFEHAIRGMRNPMNSWDKSDSYFDGYLLVDGQERYKAGYIIGENDGDLMHRLFKAGPEHRKYMRQIMVSMDIVSHHAWWTEFDTYKVGVTRNSCSKMHKIHVKEFVPDDFSHEGLTEVGGKYLEHFQNTVVVLEELRQLFNKTKEKKYWRAIIELLPMGYNMRATVTMNYENAANMIRQRTGHKLDEWNVFVVTLLNLPCMDSIINGDWGREENDNEAADN